MLGRVKCHAIRIPNPGFAASDLVQPPWILRHGTLIRFLTLLPSPPNTPPCKKGGGREGRNFLGSINGYIFSGLSSLLDSMLSVERSCWLHFLSLTIRCVIKSFALHLKSLVRLSLQKGLKWPEPVAWCIMHNGSDFLIRVYEHPGNLCLLPRPWSDDRSSLRSHQK